MAQGMKPEIAAIRKRFITLLSTNRLDKIVEQMDDKDYVDFCLSIAEYCLPKLQRTEITGEDGGALQIIQPGKPDAA